MEKVSNVGRPTVSKNEKSAADAPLTRKLLFRTFAGLLRGEAGLAL